MEKTMKRNLSTLLFILLILPLLLTQTACKSKKKRTVKTSDEINKDNYVAFFQSKNTDWELFTSKLKIEVKENKSSTNVNAVLRMNRDSTIWVSVSIMGIEGARIYITPDSFFVMEKFSRRVSLGSIQGLSDITGAEVSLSQFQNLLLGGLIFPASAYRFTPDSETSFLLKTRTDSAEIIQKFLVKNAEPLETLLRSLTTPNKAEVKYKNFQSTNLFPVPGILEIKTQNDPQSGFNISSINIDIISPEFPSSLLFPFSIPTSYEKVYY
jgi:hypothetical protein